MRAYTISFPWKFQRALVEYQSARSDITHITQLWYNKVCLWARIQILKDPGRFWRFAKARPEGDASSTRHFRLNIIKDITRVSTPNSAEASDDESPLITSS